MHALAGAAAARRAGAAPGAGAARGRARAGQGPRRPGVAAAPAPPPARPTPDERGDGGASTSSREQGKPHPPRRLARLLGTRRRARLARREAELRDIGFDPDALRAYFRSRPAEVARRAAVIASKLGWARRVWRKQEGLPPEARTRGAVLRKALSDLGPVFVKAGQTLAQRPDLVGDEAADALRRLQEANAPFDDALAFQTIAEDLAWDGPLAPDHPHRAGDPGPPLFARLSETNVASASLGQVYRATTHDGRELAVKVMRPRAVAQVALDYVCWTIALSALRRAWNAKADLTEIADYVGECVWSELDYHQEARNADTFRRAHAFLGFVTAPEAVYEYTGPHGRARVLSTLWVDGSTLSNLPTRRERVHFARMATEACVCQLVYTGFVHCDPHEGNLLMTPEADGKPAQLCFLDFGLVSHVEPHIMEGFARGVRCMIGGDYLGLVGAFRDVGFTPAEGYYRRDPETGTTELCDAQELADAVRDALEGESGGTTRFGALATGLGSLSTRYRFLTPPYIVLLCRTFLTLEGLASKADPEFNIYLAALPYAVRRALAPATAEGAAALHDTLLDEHKRVRWSRFRELMDGAAVSSSDAFADGGSGGSDAEAGEPDDADAAVARLLGLLGSTEGKSLRAVTRAADSVDLARALTGSNATAKALRESGVALLAAQLSALFSFRKLERAREARVEAQAQAREARWSKRAAKVLLGGHLRNIARAGPRGMFQLLMLVGVAVRVFFEALWRAAVDFASRLFGGGDRDAGPGSAAAAFA